MTAEYASLRFAPKSSPVVDRGNDSDYLEWILCEGELRLWLTMIAV